MCAIGPGRLFVYMASTQGAALLQDEATGHYFLTGDSFPKIYDLRWAPGFIILQTLSVQGTIQRTPGDL